MPIAYVAETRDHLLMLDDEGVCLHVHRRSQACGDDAVDGAIACIGAQYVAALDPKEPGFLAHSPTVGVPMLFAKVGANGRVTIVRTGPLQRFELQLSGVHQRPAPRARGERVEPAAIQPPVVLAPAVRFVGEDEEEPTLRLRRAASSRTRVA
jgi:hypothetical protein